MEGDETYIGEMLEQGNIWLSKWVILAESDYENWKKNITRSLQKKKEGEVGWIPKWYVGSHKERMERNIGLETIKEDHPT